MIKNGERLQKSINNFLESTNPLNILSVIKEPVLKNLVEGYSSLLSAGISIYYSENDKPESKDAYKILFNDLKNDFTHPICKCFRKSSDKNKHVCIDFDKHISFLYYKKIITGPILYRCHLNLWDMAYPLIINDKLLGVLFGGQIIVKDRTDDLCNELNDYADEVYLDINTLSKMDDKEISCQIDEVRNSIQGLEVDLKKSIEEKLNEEFISQNINYYIGFSQLLDRYKSFKGFGNMLESLTQEIYEAKEDAATRELIQTTSEFMSNANLFVEEVWNDFYEKLFKKLYERVEGMNPIAVFIRDRDKFIKRIPYEKDEKIQAKYVVPIIREDVLIRLCSNEQDEKMILDIINSGNKDIWVYRSDYRQGNENLSTLIVFKGQNCIKYKKFLESFCRMISARMDLSTLVFRLRAQQRSFRLSVGEVAHSFRTPLTALLFDLERIKECLDDDCELNELLKESQDRLFDAKEDIVTLLEDSKYKKEECNLAELVNEVCEYLKPIADSHPCKLVKEGDWPENVFVYISRDKIRWALIDLIENAIKYSWGTKTVNGFIEYYKVRIIMKLVKGNMIEVQIINYGIGIPPDIIKSFDSPGNRAAIFDRVQRRPGTGWGVFIAKKNFCEHGGWIDIESNPADSDPRSKEEEYHRYLTTVFAYLPIVKRMENANG